MMSHYYNIKYIAICDVCGKQIIEDVEYNLTDKLKSLGWQIVSGRLTCKDCWEKEELNYWLKKVYELLIEIDKKLEEARKKESKGENK